MIHIKELSEGEKTYTHQDDKTGEYRIFAVDRMALWIEAHSLEVLKVKFLPDAAFAKFVLENRGIEPHRLLRCDISFPITLLLMSDDTHLIVDGNHRYVKAAMVGAELKANMLIKEQWEQFLVEGVSADLAAYSLSAFSGIE